MRKRQFQAVRQSDQSNLTRKNLIKMKKRLEEQLELMRGNASLTDIAKIETQIEKLDRALKRFSALSLTGFSELPSSLSPVEGLRLCGPHNQLVFAYKLCMTTIHLSKFFRRVTPCVFS